MSALVGSAVVGSTLTARLCLLSTDRVEMVWEAASARIGYVGWPLAMRRRPVFLSSVRCRVWFTTRGHVLTMTAAV